MPASPPPMTARRAAADFPEARQWIPARNATTHRKRGKTEEATRHFISSFSWDESSPRTVAQSTCRNWSSESRHWQRHVCRVEDRCRLRSADAACALTLIRTRLQALVRRAGRKSLASEFEDVADHLGLGQVWLIQCNLQQ